MSLTLLLPCTAANMTVISDRLPLKAQTPQIGTREITHSAVIASPNLQLSAEELSSLENHDVVLIIDKSRSMNKEDCRSVLSNSRISRWEWCREQAMDITQQTGSVLPAGIKVVLYSTTFDVHTNVHPAAVNCIFSETVPDGGTDTAAVLRSQLSEYFQKREKNGETKPLVIAIVTDGRPDSPIQLRQTIVAATKLMKDKQEVIITFLQIGKDPQGSRFLAGLSDRLEKEQARYDIVDVKQFGEVTANGLARSIAQAVGRESDNM